jgi:hypothetical protein
MYLSRFALIPIPTERHPHPGSYPLPRALQLIFDGQMVTTSSAARPSAVGTGCSDLQEASDDPAG